LLDKNFFERDLGKTVNTFAKEMNVQPTVKLTLTDGTSFNVWRMLKAVDSYVLLRIYDQNGQASVDTIIPYEAIRRIEVLKESGARRSMGFEAAMKDREE
jgi:hypothetical protein